MVNFIIGAGLMFINCLKTGKASKRSYDLRVTKETSVRGRPLWKLKDRDAVWLENQENQGQVFHCA